MGGTDFFFNDTATTEIYTLSLHDALPIFIAAYATASTRAFIFIRGEYGYVADILERAVEEARAAGRSEEHTSELQSRSDLVCRLLLEKKNSLPSSAEPYAA